MKNLFKIKDDNRCNLIEFLGLRFKIYKRYSLMQRIKFNKLDKKNNYINNNYNKNHSQALMTYNYLPIGNYNPTNVNLGDYIQSLAAKQYLKDNLKYIDRDSTNSYKDKNINLIMNGWHYISNKNNNISEKITPLYISFHLNNPYEITPETIKMFKNYEPIGCRDIATRNFLLSKGVKAYFSSCLTTTLDIKYKTQEKERKGIIFCDYSFKKNDKKSLKINKEINKILKNYKNENIENTTHIYPLNSSQEKRFKLAEDLIKKYAQVKLVITTRIHCALPCLALETPVILICENYDKERYDGLFDFFNVIGWGRKKIFIKKILFEKNLVKNPSVFEPYAEELKKKIYSWIDY